MTLSPLALVGLRNASVTSLSAVGGGVDPAVIQQPRSQSRQSQSPTISDSGIGMDSNSPGAHHNPSSPVRITIAATGLYINKTVKE